MQKSDLAQTDKRLTNGLLRPKNKRFLRHTNHI